MAARAIPLLNDFDQDSGSGRAKRGRVRELVAVAVGVSHHQAARPDRVAVVSQVVNYKLMDAVIGLHFPRDDTKLLRDRDNPTDLGSEVAARQFLLNDFARTSVNIAKVNQ